MLDFTLPSMPSRVPPRAAAPAVVDRPSAEADAVDTGDDSFASTLDALADGREDQTEASDASAEEDSATSPIVPATAPLPDAIQPVVVPGWMVALRGDGPQEDAAEGADGAATPDAGTAPTGEGTGTHTFGTGLPQTGPVAAAASGETPPSPAPAAAPGPQASPAVLAESVAASDEQPDTVQGDSAQESVQLSAREAAIDTFASVVPADAAIESADAERETRAPARASQTPATPPAFHLSVEQSDSESPVAERRAPAASLAAFFQESAAVAAPREGALSFEFSGHGGESPVFAAQIKTSSAAFASALANTPAFDALPSETTTQIVQAMRLQLARGGGEAHIKLEPHHFGDLKVTIKVDQGQVTARLEAEVPVVREWLQSNQALLRTSLAEQNLTLDRLEVAEPRDTRDSEERQQQKEERPKPQSSRRRRSESRDVFEVVA